MTTFYALCEKLRPGCSRTSDKTYVNVIADVGSSPAPWETIVAKPKWSDPESNQFVVELTEAKYALLHRTEDRYHEGRLNLPRWQQRVASAGATLEMGSFATPTNAGSAWGTSQIPDDRLIVRIFRGDPGSGGVHIAREHLAEDLVTGFVTRHLKLYSAADVASGMSAESHLVEIAGRQILLDIAGGVSTIRVATNVPGEIPFPSNHEYRVVGPNGEKSVVWRVYGRTLTVR